MLCHTGDRAGDLALLRVEHVLIAEGSVHVMALLGKCLDGTAPKRLLFEKAADQELCVVEELNAYKSIAPECGVDLSGGYLFRSKGRGKSAVGDCPVSSNAMNERLKEHLRAMGLWDGETSHSARVGCSVSLVLLGVDRADLKAHLGWKTDSTVDRYVGLASAYKQDRAANALTQACSEDANPNITQVSEALRRNLPKWL